MDGLGVQFLYLAMALTYMLMVMRRRRDGRSLRWKINAALAWTAIFIGLAWMAERLDLRLP